jgi:hypothetical protein
MWSFMHSPATFFDKDCLATVRCSTISAVGTRNFFEFSPRRGFEFRAGFSDPSIVSSHFSDEQSWIEDQP